MGFQTRALGDPTHDGLVAFIAVLVADARLPEWGRLAAVLGSHVHVHPPRGADLVLGQALQGRSARKKKKR
jgi:hypothetical protein